MRNYQYLPEEEAEMDAFGNEWKKTNRGIKGLSAWRQFKQQHRWAKKITADALRQKYVRMKRDQYRRAYAVAHADCPVGHATCSVSTAFANISSLSSSVDDYVSRSTETLNSKAVTSLISDHNTALPTLSTAVDTSVPSPTVKSAPSTPSATAVPTVASGPVVNSTEATTQSVSAPNTLSTSAVSSLALTSSVTSNTEDVVTDDIPVELPSTFVAPKQQIEGKIVLHDTIDGDTGEADKSHADGKTGLENVERIAEADELFRRVIQVMEGRLIATRIDGHLMLIPRNEDGNFSAVAVRDVLEQTKRVLMDYLDRKCIEFQQKFSILTVGGNSESVSELIKQLKVCLQEEIDKLIGKLMVCSN